jgi:hypothetical protein
MARIRVVGVVGAARDPTHIGMARNVVATALARVRRGDVRESVASGS